MNTSTKLLLFVSIEFLLLGTILTMLAVLREISGNDLAYCIGVIALIALVAVIWNLSFDTLQRVKQYVYDKGYDKGSRLWVRLFLKSIDEHEKAISDLKIEQEKLRIRLQNKTKK